MAANKSKKPLPAERWSNLVSGRLNNKQIFDLFDEFGMAKRLQNDDDYEWVKANLPNNPEELKKILKIEIDKENKARKDAMKPVEVPLPAQPAMSSPVEETPSNTASGPEMGAQEDGQGGPDTTIASTTPKWTTSKDFSLVKFNVDPNGAEPGDASTVWLADSSNKTLRPVMSMQALRDMYDSDNAYQAAINSITTLSPTDSRISGFTDYGADYGVYEGGTAPKAIEFSASDLSNSYGQTASEDKTLEGVQVYDSFLSLLSNEGSGISSSYINQVKNNKDLTGLYVNALAYGGYTPDDVYKDIKKRELMANGDTSMANVKVISPTVQASYYLTTAEGSRATNIPALTPPKAIGNVSREVWSSVASKLSDEYYALTNPEEYDPTSAAWKEKLASVQSALHDYVIKAMESGTEQDKQVADMEWSNYKTDLETATGYKLSDNAIAAWKQLQEIDKSFTESGTAQSGLQNEAVDEKLKEYRESNKRTREAAATAKDEQEAKVAAASYSPAQIKALNDEDAAKGLDRSQWRTVKWGLTPAVAMSLSSFISDFRTKYPNAGDTTDEEIKTKYYDNLYDENGNYRSKLYQNYQDNLSKVNLGYTLSEVPNTSRARYQADTLAQKKLDEEEKLQKDATSLDAGNAFDANGNPIKNYGQETTVAPIGEASLMRTIGEKNAANTPEVSTENVSDTKNASGFTMAEANDPKNWKDGKFVGNTQSVTGTENRYKIKNTDEMATYKPSEYERVGTSVYLKSGLTPETAVKNTSTNTTATINAAKNEAARRAAADVAAKKAETDAAAKRAAADVAKGLTGSKTETTKPIITNANVSSNPTGTTKMATVWKNNDPTTKKAVKVGSADAFAGGYSLYTGK